MENKNPMQTVKIEKLSLNVGATGDALEKGVKLLSILTGKKPAKMKSVKRIPTWGVRPKLEVGAVVTLRKDIKPILKRLLTAEDNQFKAKQVSTNSFSFGIREYIEIPGMEYQRDLGIVGLDVTITFVKSGRRVKLKKTKKGKFPARQMVSKEEIIKYMEENFQTKFV